MRRCGAPKTKSKTVFVYVLSCRVCSTLLPHKLIRTIPKRKEKKKRTIKFYCDVILKFYVKLWSNLYVHVGGKIKYGLDGYLCLPCVITKNINVIAKHVLMVPSPWTFKYAKYSMKTLSFHICLFAQFFLSKIHFHQPGPVCSKS